MLNEYLTKVNALEADLEKLRQLMKISELDNQINQMECRFNSEGWNDIPALQEYNKLRSERDGWIFISIRLNDLKEMIRRGDITTCSFAFTDGEEYGILDTSTNKYKAVHKTIKIGQFKNPSSKVLFAEGYYTEAWPSYYVGFYSVSSYNLMPLHNNGKSSTIGYMDGHVETLTYSNPAAPWEDLPLFERFSRDVDNP